MDNLKKVLQESLSAADPGHIEIPKVQYEQPMEYELFDKAQATIESKVPDFSRDDIATIQKKLLEMADATSPEKESEENLDYLGSKGDELYYVVLTKGEDNGITKAVVYSADGDELKVKEYESPRDPVIVLNDLVDALGLDSISYKLLKDLGILEEEPEEPEPEPEQAPEEPEPEPEQEPEPEAKQEQEPPEELDKVTDSLLEKYGLKEGDLDKDLKQKADKYWEELVPEFGKADTLEGELLRAIGKIRYRYYNDGDYFWDGYGIETAGPAAAFLLDMAKRIPELERVGDLLEEARGKTGKEYEECIDNALQEILDYIESKQGKYTPNLFDMLSDEYHKKAEELFGNPYAEEEAEWESVNHPSLGSLLEKYGLKEADSDFLTPEEFQDVWEKYLYYVEGRNWMESHQEGKKARKWFEENFPKYDDEHKRKLTKKFRLVKDKLKDLVDLINPKREEIRKFMDTSVEGNRR